MLLLKGDNEQLRGGVKRSARGQLCELTLNPEALLTSNMFLHENPFWSHKTAQACFHPVDSLQGKTCSNRAHPVPTDTARPVDSGPRVLQPESARGHDHL